jgi:very-short-patch-repair endonuclease
MPRGPGGSVLRVDQILGEISRALDGVVPRERARARGISDKQLRTRIASGVLARVTRDVFIHTSAAPSPDRLALRLACVASRGVVSHRTAGRLHGLVNAAPALPDVTVVDGRHPRSELATVHRLEVLLDEDVEVLDGLPVTTPVRTMIDLGTKVPFGILERAYERGVDRDLFTFDDVVRKRYKLARRGRDGVGVVHDLLAVLDPDLSAAESDLETLLWRVLRESGVRLPERQVVVMAGRYRLDLAYVEERVFLEGDGFGFHRTKAVFERDRWRQNDLVLDGWMPLRFTWQMIVKQPSEVVRAVRSALVQRQSS